MVDIEIEAWPDLGGKIASLRAAGREWLVPGLRWTHPPSATTRFVDVEVSGWDEMFPTIDACFHDGHHVPDHGEAWRFAWDGAGNEMRWASPTWGCELHRTITTEGSGLRLDYRLTGDRSIDFLWAAHPLLVAAPGTRIELPSRIRSVVDVSSGDPVTVRWDQRTASIDSVPSSSYRKYVLAADQRVGWAAVVHPDGTWLRLSWPVAEVPYLALYLEREAFTRSPCIAIEPMTGWFDSLAMAAANGTASTVDAEHPAQWWIEVDVGVGVAALHE